MFLILTLARDGKPVVVNTDQILQMVTDNAGKYTDIKFRKDVTVSVEESLGAIGSMLKAHPASDA